MYQSDVAPWLEFFAWNTDGSAKTDLVYNTSGISIVVVRDNLANSSALTLSAASGPTDWAAGKFHAMGGNKYRVGIATASISSFTGQISVEGSYTGGVLTGVTREVSAYDPTKNPLSPTTPGRTLDVSSGGEAGIDLANVGSPTTTLNLSGLTIKNSTDVKTIVDLIYTVVQLTDASVSTMAVDTRNAILNRVLAGNHTTSGTVGLLLQFLDALISSRLAPATAGRTLAVSAAGGVELDSAVEAVINDIPNTAEFQARTLAAASYATAAQINSLQVNTRASVQVPVEIETPDSGTQVWKIRLFLFDSDGNMEAPDSTPTVALVNASGTDRSSRLSAATTLSTGAYSWDYTSTDDDAEEQLNWTFTVVEGGLTRIYPATSYVVEETAYRFTSTDRSTLNSRASSTEVTTVGTAVAAVSTKLGTPAGASVSADIASVKTDATTLLGRVTSNVYQMFLDLIAMITGSGTSDAGWDEAALSRVPSSGSSTNPTTMLSTTIATVTSQTEIILTAGAPDNDVYNDQMAVLTDASTSTQKAKVQVLDYVASTKTLTLSAAPGFTVASGDSIAIIAVQNLTAAQNARLSLLGAGTRQTVKADSGASIELKIGDDYVAAINTAKRIEINDVDGSIYDAIRTETHTARTFGFGYIKAGAKSSDVVTGTIDRSTVTYTAASGSVKAYTTVFVEMSLASTLVAGCGKYDIQVTHSNGKKQTLFTGDCELVTDYKS